MRFEDLPRGKPGTHVESGSAVRDLWLNPALLGDGFWQHNARKILLGATLDGDLVGIADNRHLITVAGSRTGKGVSAIIPNLLTYEGSVLVLDPKGENATIAAERRGRPVRRSGDPPPQGSEWLTAGGMGHEVHVIDPFGAAKVPDEFRSGFNPLTAGIVILGIPALCDRSSRDHHHLPHEQAVGDGLR